MEGLRSLAGESVDIQPLDPGPLERYSMGPSTALSLWEGIKKDMKLDRGPCKLSFGIFIVIANMCRENSKRLHSRAGIQ